MDAVDFSFYKELKAVELQLQQEIYFKAGNFDELVQLPLNDLGQHGHPAMVLAVSRACGYQGDQSIRLASIIQYVYIADQVHGLMRDDEELPEENRQFPVLVGDALYGNFFLGLCRGNMLNFLEPLAEVICTMNEGAISRWRFKDQELDTAQQLIILGQERASLTSRAAGLSAQLAGVNGTLLQQIEEFGHYVGMAWAAYEQNMARAVVADFAQRGLDLLRQLSVDGDLRWLYEFYDYLLERVLPESGLSPAYPKA